MLRGKRYPPPSMFINFARVAVFDRGQEATNHSHFCFVYFRTCYLFIYLFISRIANLHIAHILLTYLRLNGVSGSAVSVSHSSLITREMLISREHQVVFIAL